MWSFLRFGKMHAELPLSRAMIGFCRSNLELELECLPLPIRGHCMPSCRHSSGAVLAHSQDTTQVLQVGKPHLAHRCCFAICWQFLRRALLNCADVGRLTILFFCLFLRSISAFSDCIGIVSQTRVLFPRGCQMNTTDDKFCCLHAQRHVVLSKKRMKTRTCN